MKAIKRLLLKKLFKYLLIGENLSWKTHIHSVANKTSKNNRAYCGIKAHCFHLHTRK